MTGLSRTSADLDPRRKRILFRAWHRGTREMDLIMGRWTESVIETLSEAEMDTLEVLIEQTDRELFSWISQSEPLPSEHDTPIIRTLMAFHTHDKPIDL